jgi:NAD(P)-dependent dehydrogenase (short-subunit alcohol dehydrogenase family)
MLYPPHILAQNGRTVLITGAAKRIGRAMAIKLAMLGYRVGIHYHHSSQDAALLTEEVHELGGFAFSVQADLSDPEQVSALIPGVVAEHGAIWGLIHNASHFEPDSIQTLTYDSFRMHMDVNLFAPLLLSQHFAKQFQDHYLAANVPTGAGNIIHMLDYSVQRLPRGFMSYVLSKTGLWTATSQLATSLAPYIRVNAIAPGFVMPHSRQAEGKFDRLADENLLGKRVTPAHIADIAAFLLEAHAITGQMITMDGGRSLMPQESAMWSK